MLEKIVNISAGSDYKQSSKPGKQSAVSNYINSYHAVSNDSISLSPATAFLSGIGWKLKKIQNEKEKLHIVFSFDDFDFSTVINPAEIIQIPRIEYEIKYSISSYTGVVNMTIKVASPLNLEGSESLQIKLHLNELNKFFGSIISTFGFRSDVSSNTYEVQKYFLEMESALQMEFNYLNKGLINFLEKYLSCKINLKNDESNTRHMLELKLLQINKT
ncbi:MAG: hypothetical protein NTX65_11460 [Ignavibacteriales bacterium]|nr:hypothetical protein [Ignavibacteriales bacterium]